MQRIITNISLDIEDRAAVAQLSHLLRHTPMLEKLYLICHLTILQLTAAGQQLPALRLVHFTYLNAVNLRTYTFEDIVRPLRCLLVPASALKRVHLTVKGVPSGPEAPLNDLVHELGLRGCAFSTARTGAIASRADQFRLKLYATSYVFNRLLECY